MPRAYKTLSISLPPEAVQELTALGQSTNRTGARVAAEIVLHKLRIRAESVEEARLANRQRLTALVAAGTKLDQATRLVKEALVDVASLGLVPIEDAQKITVNIGTYLRRILSVIELIP